MEIIKITTNEKGNEVVSAKELYNTLELKKDFTTWFKKMASYGFEEHKDFTPFRVESTGGRPSSDYAITLDMAKHIAMLQRTEQGMKIRQYFIDYEKTKVFNQFQIPTTLSGALLLASQQAEQIEQQQLLLEQTNNQLQAVSTKVNEQANQLKEQEPKVVFADAVIETGESILIGHLATLITQAGFEIGQNRLFKLLRDLGYLGCVGEKYNKPLQKYVQAGIFELKYTEFTDNNGKKKMTTVTKVTPVGQEFFINLFKI